MSFVDSCIAALRKAFPVKDLGRLNYFPGTDVTYLAHSILLSQQRYIAELISKAGMDNSKPCLTPMVSSPTLSKHIGTVLPDGE